jgi:antitoxin component of MazEF toxin-antitoxin module
MGVRVLVDRLNGVSLPIKVQIEERFGECWVHIPNDFAKALGLKSGRDLHMYVRGGKLVLETPKTRKKRAESVCGGRAHDLIEAQNPPNPIGFARAI